jgi:hypothetical protein
MTVPEPWNDKNNCFIYTNPGISSLLTEDQKEQMIYVNPNSTTYIRSNLAITDGGNVSMPNVYEAIATLYDMIANIREEIESLKPQPEE